jgi:hypothetical protein
LAVLLADGISVFLLLIVLGTQQAYGWQAVLTIILITEILALSIAFFNNKKYQIFNQSLESKKENLKGRE